MRYVIGWRVTRMRYVIGWRVGQHMRPLDHIRRSPRPEGSRCYSAPCRGYSPRGHRSMRHALEGCAVRPLWLGGGGGRATCDSFVVRLRDRLVCLGLPARRRANNSVTGGGEGGAMSTTQRVRTCSRCTDATEQHAISEYARPRPKVKARQVDSAAPMPLPFGCKQQSCLL